jgi:hypothetical protein
MNIWPLPLQGVHTMLRIVILSTLIFLILTTPCLSESFKSTGTIDAYFSPRGGTTEAIVKERNSALLARLIKHQFFDKEVV